MPPIAPAAPSSRRRLRGAVGATLGALAIGACGGVGTTATGPAPTTGVGTVRPAALQIDPASARVLFVRGGVDTAGTPVALDNELSDITSTQPKGYNLLTADLVEKGFQVTQIEEGPADSRGPADLTAIGLDNFDVLFLASNNATYSAADVTMVTDWVRDGGSLLVTGDTNWGTTGSDAEDSDQQFLTPFGITMGLDSGLDVSQNGPGWTMSASDALEKTPILDDVTTIGGIGVTSYRKVQDVPGVTVTGLIRSKGMLKDRGSTELRAPTVDDFGLMIATLGEGRVACIFDRDTFFNQDIGKNDNRRFALNLFTWLAEG